jgi:choline dehydrogenase
MAPCRRGKSCRRDFFAGSLAAIHIGRIFPANMSAAYDYVIVGGGSAGCVLANHLSSDRHARVLLLEAGGPDHRKEIHVPAGFPKLFKTALDWNYQTEPQQHLAGRRLYWPRGKVLGGSSSINAMIYIRGAAQDYDGWQAAGNSGWGYADVLPYFMRAENQERGADRWHGVGGPLSVCDLRHVHPLSRAFVEAATEIGLARNNDFNGACQLGVGAFQVNQRGGARHSTAVAYLRPARGRANLTVITGAQATRVVVERDRAIGVEFERAGQRLVARARQEVLLCGGAVNSPQLLLLSGIGPAEQVRALGIPVVADLPGVGENLQDHLVVAVAYECRQAISMATADTLANRLRYLLMRRGPLASNIGEVGGFVRTRADLPAADLQFHFGPAYFLEHGFKTPDGHGFTLGPTLLRPRSRGRITLASADPLRAPRIEPNYLADEADLAVLVEGVKLARRIAQAAAFAPYRGDEYCPGTAAQGDDALADFVRQTVETIYHPVGTCKMGTDERAVVDPRLRVRGVWGLRVVDASIMPTIPGGNTNAPVIMIAEKAADMILEDARSAATHNGPVT